MKCCVLALILLTAVAEADVNPIQKVVQLISGLEAKLIKDGDAEDKAYDEYMDWCKNGAKDKKFEIITAKSDIESLEATISKAGSEITVHHSEIGDLAAALSTDDADLKAATQIRERENSDFSVAEAELVDALDTLDRAIGLIEKNMRGSALMQAKVDTKNVATLVQVLGTVIDAASLNAHDKQTLLAFAQSTSGSSDSDDDADVGAPAPEAYKSHGSSIVDLLEDMKEKAESQLSELRKAEVNARHNYELLKQSLDDQTAANNAELQEAKTGKASAEEVKAVAEGDLAVTKKDLANAEEVLAGMSESCMQTATDRETSVKGRTEELATLAKAKEVISASTSGAEAKTYSLLQISGQGAQSMSSGLQNRMDLANFEVVNLVKQLAQAQHSKELSLLASRIGAAYRSAAAAGEDPFAKVKQLISEMISRLTKEGAEEAKHKAWCDEETAKSAKKRAELSYDIEKLSTKIDKAKSMSAKLKEDASTLAKELLEIAKSQSEMDKTRTEAHAAFLATKADLDQGLEGIRTALQVLRDYYATESEGLLQEGTSDQQPAKPDFHGKSEGAAGGIIGLLEVVESDLAKNLAEEETGDDESAEEYERISQENRVSKVMKEQDVKYKSKEAASLDKAVSEDTSDLDGAQSELDAVLESTKTLRGMCDLKVEPYAERKARREAEMNGLKEALSILDGEAVFLQKKGQGLRGVKPH